MIKNPKHGWCDFELGDFKGHPSYLTDVPLDLLSAFISYHTAGYGSVVFDEEGSFFTLVLTEYNSGIYIIEEKEKAILHDFSDLKVEKLEDELVSDISSNLEEWARFILDEDDNVDEHIAEIKQKLEILNIMKNMRELEKQAQC